MLAWPWSPAGHMVSHSPWWGQMFCFLNHVLEPLEQFFRSISVSSFHSLFISFDLKHTAAVAVNVQRYNGGLSEVSSWSQQICPQLPHAFDSWPNSWLNCVFHCVFLPRSELWKQRGWLCQQPLREWRVPGWYQRIQVYLWSRIHRYARSSSIIHTKTQVEAIDPRNEMYFSAEVKYYGNTDSRAGQSVDIYCI